MPYVDSEFDREPWLWDPSGLPAQKSNIASVFSATCELLRIARRVMDFVCVRRLIRGYFCLSRPR